MDQFRPLERERKGDLVVILPTGASVAVVIPARNARATLGLAVRTVQAQTRPVQQIIVVDDHSDDGTDKLIAEMAAKDSRIQLVRAPNHGAGHARNVGVAAARSEIIAFLDADDVWYPDKVETQLPYLVEGVAFVGGLLHYLGQDGSVLGSYLPFEDWDEATESLRRAETMPVSLASALLRREDFVATGGFDETFLRTQDLELAQRLVASGRRVVWPPGRALGGYVLHSGAVSATSYREQFLAAELVRARVRGECQGQVSYDHWQRLPRLSASARRRLISGEHYRKAAVARGAGDRMALVHHGVGAVVADPVGVLGKLRRRRRHQRMLTPAVPPAEVLAQFRLPLPDLPTTIAEVPVIDVAGLQLVTDPWMLAEAAVRDYVHSPRPLLLYAAHVTSLNHVRDKDFVSAFNLADAAYVDGVSWALIAAAGGQRATKVATTDLAPQVIRRLAIELGRPVRVAVLGGAQGVGTGPSIAERAGHALQHRLPARLVQAAHGYHADWEAVLPDLRAARPDIVVLGLGMPLEAFWGRAHRDLLPPALVLTCGGWLRILSGDERRAPVRVQRFHLEWAYRITYDPRTFGRYARGFVGLVRESARAAYRRCQVDAAY